MGGWGKGRWKRYALGTTLVSMKHDEGGSVEDGENDGEVEEAMIPADRTSHPSGSSEVEYELFTGNNAIHSTTEFAFRKEKV